MSERKKIKIAIQGPDGSGSILIGNLIAEALAEAGMEVLHDGLQANGNSLTISKRVLKNLGVHNRSTIQITTAERTRAVNKRLKEQTR